MRLFVNPNASNLMSGTGTSTTTNTQPLDTDLVSIKLTIVTGDNFPIEKRGPLINADIPDCYCKVKLSQPGTISTSSTSTTEGVVWRTSTVENQCHPTWNESTEYHDTSYGTTISISVYDEDKGLLDNTDDYLGTTDVSVRSLIDLSHETEEIELNLIQHGKISGPTITVKCLVL